METTLAVLGDLVRSLREQKGLTQDQAVRGIVPSTNRSALAHLEQGLRAPPADVLEGICRHIGVPAKYWRPFAEAGSQRRIAFEEAISELVGRAVGLGGHEASAARAASDQIARAFDSIPNEAQALDLFNSILTYFGVQPVSRAFFHRYLGAESLQSPESLLRAVRRFQADAIRLFSSFAAAYEEMNTSGDLDLCMAPCRRQLGSDFV